MVYENGTNVKAVAEVHCPVCNWRIMDVEKGTKGGIQVKCDYSAPITAPIRSKENINSLQ